MSWTQTLKIEFAVPHSLEEDGLDLTAGQLLAALKAKVAAFEADPVAMRTEMLNHTRESEIEDAWVLRSAHEARGIVRDGYTTTLHSARDLLPSDIKTYAAAVEGFVVDPSAIYVPLEYFDQHLCVAELRAQEDDKLVGLLDVRRYLFDSRREAAEDFASDPDFEAVTDSIRYYAQRHRSPSALCAKGEDKLNIVIRDKDHAVDIACDLYGLTSNYGLQP